MSKWSLQKYIQGSPGNREVHFGNHCSLTAVTTNTTCLNTKNLLLCHIHVSRTVRTMNSYSFPRMQL